MNISPAVAWPTIMLLALLAPAGQLGAAETLHDPNLPSVPPQALQQLSETRIRQQIMRESQAPYYGRCVCQYQVRDADGRSCAHRHEAVHIPPLPICFPAQVTQAMIAAWRREHAE